MKLKKYFLIIACNILLLTFLIIVVEWGASFIATKLGQNIIPNYRLNHSWKPNSKYIHSEWVRNNPQFHFPYTHYYNEQGWVESYNVKKVKPLNTYRIFYLGDSFTEGTCPMEQSVPSIVESRLNELIKQQDIKVEVINTGTGGYSPTLYYILLRYVLLDYDPDMIVIMIDMTDYFDDLKYAQTLIRDEQGNPWACPPRVISYPIFIDTRYKVIIPTWQLNVQLWLASHSYIYNLLIKLKEEQPPPSPFQNTAIKSHLPVQQVINWPWSWCQQEWDNTTRKNVDNTLDMISRIALLCRQHQIKLMITSVPHYQQYAGNSDGTGSPLWSSRPHKEIAMVAKRLDVPYLDSFSALRPFILGTPQTQYYYFGDMHFNPKGYELWANIHFDFISDKKHKLLPESFSK